MMKARKMIIAAALGMMLLNGTSTLAYNEVADPFITYFQKDDGNAKGFDYEQFVEMEISKDMVSDLYYWLTYSLEEQNDPAIIGAWAAKGLTKTVYDKDDASHMWSVFVPNGIYFSAEENYQYPVVFCLHGGGNSILMTESYGYAELGGKEGFITVIPWAQIDGGDQDGNIIVEEVPRILQTLKEEGYPIDESRLYAAGFSAGGRSTANVMMAYPDQFAAVAMTTTALYPSAETADESAHGYKKSFTVDDFERATDFCVPMMLYGGTMDGNWPINFDPEQQWPVTSEDLNLWMNISGANFPEVTDETRTNIAQKSGIGVERITGLDFDLDAVEIVERQGTYCYIGSYYNDDNICTLRCLAVEGVPHWPTRCEAEFAWEFMSQFARDTETGELLYSVL